MATHARVLKALRSAEGRLEACYAPARASRPQLSGLLEYSVVLRPNGVVAKVTPRADSLDAPRVERCAIRALEDTRFPKISDTGKVELRVVFDLAP